MDTTGQNGSTALARRDEAPAAMGAFEPRSFDQAFEMCERLVKSGFLGPHIKDANQALAIAMTGHEMGFPFMASFRKVYVFQQRIGVMTQLLVGKVKSSSVCVYFRTVELTDEKCTVETLRRGAPEPEKYTFTMEMARKAGFVEKNPKYKTEPQRMLYARAAGYLCNDVYADLTMGMDPAETLDDEPQHVGARVTDAPVTPLRAVERGPIVETQARPAPAETEDEKVERFTRELRAATNLQAAAPTIRAIQSAFPEKEAPPRLALKKVLDERHAANWAPWTPPQVVQAEPAHDADGVVDGAPQGEAEKPDLDDPDAYEAAREKGLV